LLARAFKVAHIPTIVFFICNRGGFKVRVFGFIVLIPTILLYQRFPFSIYTVVHYPPVSRCSMKSRQVSTVKSPESLGQAYDAALIRTRVIAGVHIALGLVSAFGVWNNDPPAHLGNITSRGGGWIMIVLSIFGWGPYLLSWNFSRRILRDSNLSVSVFSLGATVVTAVAVSLYQNVVYLTSHRTRQLIVSIGVWAMLTALASVCWAIWPPNDDT
jgi:hypothetical protein